jgi:hypothetical protein
MNVQSIMKEVREARVRMSHECGNDPSKLVAYLQQYNRKCARQVGRYRRTHPACEKVADNGD